MPSIVNRRTLLGAAAGASLIVAGCRRVEGKGQSDTLAIHHAEENLAKGIWADNLVAQYFTPSEHLRLPLDLILANSMGPKRLGDLLKPWQLIAVWAEWCAPCLAELPDLSRLNATTGGPSFQILPILSGSRSKLDPARAKALFADRGIDGFDPYVEPDGGAVLYKGFTKRKVETERPRPSLPANLLVDGEGRIIARQDGFPIIEKPGAAADAYENLEAGFRNGDLVSLWGTPDATAWARAAASGAFA